MPWIKKNGSPTLNMGKNKVMTHQTLEIEHL